MPTRPFRDDKESKTWVEGDIPGVSVFDNMPTRPFRDDKESKTWVEGDIPDGFLVRLVDVRSLHPLGSLNHWSQSFELLRNGFREVDNSLTNPVAGDLPHVIEERKVERNRKKVDNSLTNPVAGDIPHVIEERKVERNRKKFDNSLTNPVADDVPHLIEVVDNSLTIPVAGYVPHVIEERKVKRNRKKVDNSLTNPVAGDVSHVIGVSKDGSNRKGLLKNKGIAVICFLLMIGFGGGASSSNGVCSDSKDLEVSTSGPLKVGNDMKLICRHNCTSGTPRWDKDKPIGSQLTSNGYVLLQYLQKITLDNHSNEYNLIFKNVTFADIHSTYTCHYGYASKQIRPIEDYEVLPNDESISKQSVYENNVLNGTLEFKEVYPIPECLLYCDDKRQKEILICETCKTWERDFFKVKFTFNIDLNNKNCREENVSVRCAVGRENYKYDFSKLPKNKETAGILIGVIIGVLVGFAVLGSILYKLYKHGAFRRCQRDRNEENPEGIQLKSEHSPDCGNDSQNISQENDSLLQEEALNLSDTNDSNRQISKHCYQSNEISRETKNGRFRETLNQTKQKQQEMHSDGLKNSKTVAKIASTKPGVNNESTSVHDAVNICEECSGTGQTSHSPDHVVIHCDRRKSVDQSTRATGSELKKEISLGDTNVKASEQMSTSDVPNLHADSSFSGGKTNSSGPSDVYHLRQESTDDRPNREIAGIHQNRNGNAEI